MKTLSVDITFLHDQYYRRGIGRYGIEITRRLIKQAAADSDWHLALLGFGDLHTNLELLEDPELVGQVNGSNNISFQTLGTPQLSSPGKNLRRYYLHDKALLQTLKPDLHFAVYFERMLPIEVCPCAVVVHDIIPMATGQYTKKGFPFNLLKGLYYRYFMWGRAKHAKQVFTCSNFSAMDLVEIGRLDESKLNIIYLGVSDIFAREYLAQQEDEIRKVVTKFDLLHHGQTQDYLIYDGGLEANKNADILLQVFDMLHEHYRDLKLVVTGGDFAPSGDKIAPANPRAEAFMQLARELNAEDAIVPVGRISEFELAALLYSAKAYINLSGYEGFGFGPLQAMRAGVPAIASDQGSFPEVSGDGALIVPVSEPRQTAAMVTELLSSPEKLTTLAKRGEIHARKFNWDETFAQTWEVLKGELFKQ